MWWECLDVQQNQFSLQVTGVSGHTVIADESIDFGANAHLAFKVDPRFYGEADARNQAAFVFGFQAVHVDPIAMH